MKFGKLNCTEKIGSKFALDAGFICKDAAVLTDTTVRLL
jgi:hypothetical protein